MIKQRALVKHYDLNINKNIKSYQPFLRSLVCKAHHAVVASMQNFFLISRPALDFYRIID